MSHQLSMKRALWILCFGFLLLIETAPDSTAQGCMPPSQAVALVEAGVVMPFSAIWEDVSQQVSGHPVGSKLCQSDDGYTYVISVKDGQIIRNVVVNARRGNIVSIR